MAERAAVSISKLRTPALFISSRILSPSGDMPPNAMMAIEIGYYIDKQSEVLAC